MYKRGAVSQNRVQKQKARLLVPQLASDSEGEEEQLQEVGKK